MEFITKKLLIKAIFFVYNDLIVLSFVSTGNQYINLFNYLHRSQFGTA